MRRISSNSFSKGINKDLARTVQPKDTYLDARNLRVNTDEAGQSFGGIINVEGNQLSFNFPTTANVFTFELSGIAPYSITLTINGTPYNFNITEDDPEDQVNELVNLINNDAALNALNIVSSAFDCKTVYLTATSSLLITLTSASPEVSNITEIIPQLSEFYIIGSTNIRDNIYLLTTTTMGEPGGDGQIWEVIYDDVTGIPSVNILYNNLMNLTIDHPAQMLGRYENDCTQKIYWTDNYNPIRVFNVAGENTFDTTLEQIDLIPIADHSAIQITDVTTGGQLLSGVYQFVYRMRSTTGGETPFSIPSALVNIVSADEDGEYKDFIGEDSGNTINKSICFKIDELDSNYDIVEVAAIYYGDEFSEAVITSFAQEPIPDTGDIELCYTGNEGGTVDLTAEEVNAITTAFSHAKTIASKDNRLFAGNVRKEPLALDFDARAYGHLQSSNVFNIDGNAETDFTTIALNANAINDDPSLNKFKQSSTLYGGTGSFVEYEIKTESILADQKLIGLAPSDFDSNPARNVFTVNPDYTIGEYTTPGFNKQGMRFPNTFGLLRGYQRDETYRFAIVFFDKTGNADFAQWIGDIKIPMSYDPARAVYGSGDGYVNGDFDGKLIRKIGLFHYINIPYIEFTVNLTEDIKDKIQGYSIVRVDRTDSDKTILGQGIAHPTSRTYTIDDTPDVRTTISDIGPGTYTFTANNSFNNINWDAAPHSDIDAGFGVYDALGVNIKSNYVTADESRPEYTTVTFPEHVFCDSIDFQQGDQIKTVDILTGLEPGNFDSDYTPSPGTDPFSIALTKFYTNSDGIGGTYDYTTNITSNIEEFHKVAKAGSVTLDDGSIFLNEILNFYRTSNPGFGAFGSAVPRNAGYGEKTIFLRLDAANPIYGNLAVAGGAPNINETAQAATAYIVNYYRPITNQYGGNTFSQRTNNVYISTNHYTDCDCDSSLSTTFAVFGGDISMGVMNNQKIIKAWVGAGSFDANHTKSSLVEYFPTESTVNVDLRHGAFFENEGLPDSGSGVDLGEEFFYNKVFSRNGDVRQFFPAPLEFDPLCAEEFDNRVYGSDVKINGENVDSWTSFPVNQFIDVEGLYGPINNLLVFNDAMLFHQDCAFGIISINPRALVQDAGGFNLKLGTGGVLDDFTNVSNQIGCKHQWGIVLGRSAVYWLDINTNKFYRYTGTATEPLSDIKGMFSFFDNNLTGVVQIGDNPLLNRGINGYYDPINNEAVFSFHGANRVQQYQFGVTYFPGDYVEDTSSPGDVYIIQAQFTAAGSPTFELQQNGILQVRFDNTYTVAFSEFINAFTSFYDFSAPVYVRHKDIILSQDRDNLGSVYRHNIGAYGNFYGQEFDSTLKFVTNEFPTQTKVFDNLEWHHEVLDYNRDVSQDTFDTVECSTGYQNSGIINLDPITNKNVKRRERTWQLDVPRSTLNRERLRDKHMEVEFTYDNINDFRMLLHYVNTIFRVSHR